MPAAGSHGWVALVSVDELGLLEKMSVQNFRQRLKVSVVDKVVCTSQRRFDLYKPASELNPRIWL